MATITFHANGHIAEYSTEYDTDPSLINHTSGSGIGFFGGGFGISVPVSQYQGSSYVTNSNGTSSGVKINNTKYLSVSGIEHNGSTVAAGTSGVPNYYAPLNVRFEHSEAVRVQNCKLRIFDRNDITKHASGVTTQVMEVRHPHPTAVHNTGSESLAYRGSDHFGWTSYDAPEAMADLAFTASPGMSGLNTSAAEVLPADAGDGYRNWLTQEGAAHQSTRHDWYIAISASPDSIGSKTDYGLYFTLEYL